MRSKFIEQTLALAALIGVVGPAAAAGWTSPVTPTRAYSENPSGQLVIQIFTAEPLFNPGSCPTLDGYIVSDPVIVNATLATSLAAISAGRQVFVYVSDSCTNGRPTVTAIGLT
jgi:hypothetical protein